MHGTIRCAYCQQPMDLDVATVHSGEAAYHFLCAMLKRREDEYRQRRAPSAA